MQILDSQDQPLYSTQDTEIKLVTNDKSILELPEKITLKKGEYFAIFSAEAKKKGTSELMALTDNIPIAEYNLNIEELSPTVIINSPDSVKQDATIEVSLLAQYSDVVMHNMNVEWSANGAQIINSDQITNENGIAMATLLVDSTSTVTIEAIVAGSGFTSTTVSKTIGILDENSETNQEQNLKPVLINGFDPLPLLIPGGIVSGAILIKKKSIIAKIKSQDSTY
ncbi:MAG: Ig-like domain-containing protein [Candidatus Nitrosotenuis sp.]